MNPKRALRYPRPDEAERIALANRVRYAGSEYHKQHDLGAFGLTPPASGRRPDASLCDPTGISSPSDALAVLRQGVRKGLVSQQWRGAFPQNIWSVHGGIPLEAQLGNQTQGTYHGYPLPSSDGLYAVILAAWESEDGL